MRIKRIIFFICVATLSINCAFAQSKTKIKKARKIVKEAQNYLDADDYYQALILYKQALLLDSMNESAGVNAAICSEKLNYVQDSCFFLIENLCASKQRDATFYLAKIKHRKALFDEAIILLTVYSKVDPQLRLHTTAEIDDLIRMNKFAKQCYSQPHDAVIKNIGPAINSRFDDYVPVILPDESTLYFTSKREGGSGTKKNSDNSYFEDVYVSLSDNGKWQTANNLGAPVNSETNDACVAISNDGQRMIVYRTAADVISGDLYTTKIGTDNKWEALALMPKEVNSPYVETSACFSNDTNELYFSSDRPGGYGGKDLYRLKKLPNQKWAMPYNLGPLINTRYDEDAPFLHPDGKTLYFSSRGHSTMGDYDVFVSTLQIENNEFSPPENLGYPINTIFSDIFFVLSVDGQRAYYSSVKPENYGGLDIYQIDTRFAEKELVIQKGRIMGDSLPLRAKITVFEKPGNELNGSYSSNPSTGNFILVLNPYKSYKAIIEAEGCDDKIIELNAIVMEKSNEDLFIKLKKSNAQ